MNIITNSQIAYIYLLLFCIHRTIISFITVFFNSYVQFNIYVNLWLGIGAVSLYLKYSPMKLKSTNRQEIMNGYIILGTFYFIMMFTNFVPDPEIRYNLGFILIYDLITFLSFTFSYIIYKMIYNCYLIRLKWNHDKAWAEYYFNKKLI